MDGLRAAWACAMSHLPQPATREQAEIIMHRARTEAGSIPLKLRAYSHRWLEDRRLPSGLPDDLRPKAERLYPKITEAVGFSYNIRMRELAPAAPLVRRAVCDAIEDIYADDPQPEVARVKARMVEIRDRTKQQLFGSLNLPKPQTV